MCEKFPVCFPHEILGYSRDSVPGILQTLELMQTTQANQERLAKTNKGKQNQRFARAKSKNPKYFR